MWFIFLFFILVVLNIVVLDWLIFRWCKRHHSDWVKEGSVSGRLYDPNKMRFVRWLSFSDAAKHVKLSLKWLLIRPSWLANETFTTLLVFYVYRILVATSLILLLFVVFSHYRLRLQ
jgi:hypothetical protein